jgi:hypothetical protein
MPSRLGLATFIVRLSRDDAGRLVGVVERVRTGEKERFESIEAISEIVARMVVTGANDQNEEAP